MSIPDLGRAIFVHAPKCDLADGGVRPRFRTYHRDCLRAAIANGRASIHPDRTVHVVFVTDERPGESPDARLFGVADVIGAQTESARAFVAVAADADERVRIMASCGLGGVASPARPNEARRAHAAAHACAAAAAAALPPSAFPRFPVLYCPPSSSPDSASDAPRRRGVRVWSRESDMLVDPPWPSPAALEDARANFGPTLAAPVLWINLDRHDGRRRHMEASLSALGVPWHRRVRAVDGSDAAELARLVRRVEGPEGDAAPDRVHACLASHVLAMKAFVDDFPEEPFAIVLEDDVSFEHAPFWPKSLQRYAERALADLPCAAGVVQLAGAVYREGQTDEMRVDGDRAIRPPPGATARLSCCAYAVSIRRARAVVAEFVVGAATSSCVVDLRKAPSPHAEAFVYAGAEAPFIPLFSALGSDSDLYPVNPASHSHVRGFMRRFWISVSDFFSDGGKPPSEKK